MDISKITDYLYIGAEPRAACAEELAARNVRLIISMIGSRRPRQALIEPVQPLWLPTFDTPLTPIPLRKLMQGVQAALPVIQDGGSVFVHCVAGRHRSVAMGAAILIAMGHSAEEAMQLIRAQRQVADPRAPYIRVQIVRFERHWRAGGVRPGLHARLYEAYCGYAASAIARVVVRMGEAVGG